MAFDSGVFRSDAVGKSDLFAALLVCGKGESDLAVGAFGSCGAFVRSAVIDSFDTGSFGIEVEAGFAFAALVLGHGVGVAVGVGGSFGAGAGFEVVCLFFAFYARSNFFGGGVHFREEAAFDVTSHSVQMAAVLRAISVKHPSRVGFPVKEAVLVPGLERPLFLQEVAIICVSIMLQ